MVKITTLAAVLAASAAAAHADDRIADVVYGPNGATILIWNKDPTDYATRIACVIPYSSSYPNQMIAVADHFRIVRKPVRLAIEDGICKAIESDDW